jgi:hypothetical protein
MEHRGLKTESVYYVGNDIKNDVNSYNAKNKQQETNLDILQEITRRDKDKRKLKFCHCA